MTQILLIDDEPDFSDALSRELRQQGHEVRCLDLAEDGLRLLAESSFHLIMLDNKMPRMSGLDFLGALRKQGINAPPVILMTSAHDADTAIQATKMGAFGYVIKPLEFDAIMPSMEEEINRALKIARPISPVPLARQSQTRNEDEIETGMIGRSKAMLKLLRSIAEAGADESVLILGETGTGKDLVARAIHTNGSRQKHPFVAVNCGALLENLLESELFGHEKGAWTGADKMRKGYFEHAHGGTLFLDEVGDMPPALQVKLLRVLQNREITRMGSCEPIEVNVRVLAATSRDLVALVHQGKFRQDLFFRLEGMTIDMPPLRERKEDIELLAKHFLARLGHHGTGRLSIHADALEALRRHPWPGNIRQLDNVMSRAARAARARRDTQILPEDLNFGKFAVGPSNEPVGGDDALAELRRAVAWAWKNEPADLWPLLQERLETELLRYASAQPGISQVQLARRLGMARNTLRARLKQYGLEDSADSDS